MKCFVINCLSEQFRCDVMLLWWQAAMDFVVEEDLKAHLTCWYIQKYVKENPQPQYFEHIYQWPYMAPTQRRRKRLPGDKHCVAVCFGVTGWFTTKDFPGIVKHDIEGLQRPLISRPRRPWAERRVDGSAMSTTRGYTLTRNRKWFSCSRLVKTWANKRTKAEACYLRQKPSGCIPTNDRRQGLGKLMRTHGSQISWCKFSVLLQTRWSRAALQDDRPRCLSPWWFGRKQRWLLWCSNCDDFYISTPFDILWLCFCYFLFNLLSLPLLEIVFLRAEMVI